MASKTTRNLVLSALFLALGLVLPFLTGQIPQVGKMLLPMHIPVLLCGLICGWQYGGAVGAVTPLLRSLLFSRPVLFPDAAAMAFELAAYGLLAGLLYRLFRRRGLGGVLLSLLGAMLGGRIVWGVARAIMSGVSDAAFTWQLFFAGAFLNAVPGIVLQLVLIPLLMLALDRVGALPFGETT